MGFPFTPFQSVLIANRGEIACRIIRTAQSIGLRTISVYSEIDAQAPHVKMADEAFLLGPASLADSYLSIDRVLTAITATKAEAVHPGYGFLSENANFAQACKDKDIVFIGPDPEAISIMGDKAKAKRRMIDAGVPCVPGYQGDDQSEDTLIAQSDAIGYPLMLKAAAGGGGRGMRLVHNKADLPSAIKLARSEAKNAFGSGDLIVEKAIIEPRHVEIQIFADKAGNTIHLGERDCSVQRRHQKVLEEAPCPVMTSQLRTQMGNAAVKAAKDINYVGAGTVEFLLDDKGTFYFLEMNTRLQVEHPVTEMVTGLDLVALQFRVANGEDLGIDQSEITLKGHAIEARLYAEDPAQDFLPATGKVEYWEPASDDNNSNDSASRDSGHIASIRIDSGIENGTTISPFYDPMIAKIIAHGETREQARQKLVKALNETTLFGVPSNRSFLLAALGKRDFIDGKATTAFITQNFSNNELATPALTAKQAAIGAILLHMQEHRRASQSSLGVPAALLNWTNGHRLATPYLFEHASVTTEIWITAQSSQHYTAHTSDTSQTISVIDYTDHHTVFEINGLRHMIEFNHPDRLATVQFWMDNTTFDLTNQYRIVTSSLDSSGAGNVTAPMHGTLIDVFVQPGDIVAKGDRLGILEAMKMQHELLAQIDGKVTDIRSQPGAQITADSLILTITPPTDDT